MSPLHSTCYKVSKNIRYVKYLIKPVFLLREGQICRLSSPTKFLNIQANRVNEVSRVPFRSSSAPLPLTFRSSYAHLPLPFSSPFAPLGNSELDSETWKFSRFQPFQLFSNIFSRFQPILIVFNGPAIFNCFQLFSTVSKCLQPFQQFSSVFSRCQPFSTSFNHFDHFQPFSTVFNPFYPLSILLTVKKIINSF